MNTKQGFAPLVWAIIAALVLAGAYIAWRNSPQSTTYNTTANGQGVREAAQVRMDTTNWKMYRSEANFVFSYPPVFTIVQPTSERVLVAFASPSCDFQIALNNLDAMIGSRALQAERWYASSKMEKVMVGEHQQDAHLVYDNNGKLQLIRVDGYLPGTIIAMGTQNSEGLSTECVNQFYTMLSTFIP